jgi:hypothetical protein
MSEETELEDQLLEKLKTTRIPGYMHRGLACYISAGRPVGDFMNAVLCNDLKKACNHADENNKHVLWDYVYFLFNHAPMVCWGSVESVQAWYALHAAKRAAHQSPERTDEYLD